MQAALKQWYLHTVTDYIHLVIRSSPIDLVSVALRSYVAQESLTITTGVGGPSHPSGNTAKWPSSIRKSHQELGPDGMVTPRPDRLPASAAPPHICQLATASLGCTPAMTPRTRHLRIQTCTRSGVMPPASHFFLFPPARISCISDGWARSMPGRSQHLSGNLGSR